MMDPIKQDIRNSFFLDLFGGLEVDNSLKDILGHNVKRGCLGISEHRKSEYWGNRTFTASW